MLLTGFRCITLLNNCIISEQHYMALLCRVVAAPSSSCVAAARWFLGIEEPLNETETERVGTDGLPRLLVLLVDLAVRPLDWSEQHPTACKVLRQLQAPTPENQKGILLQTSCRVLPLN